MDDSPKLITRGMVEGALRDDAFFKQVPEFLTLKSKLSVLEKASRGCCGSRTRAAKNLLADFLSVLSTLSDASIGKLKRYFGVSKLMYTAQDPRTCAYKTRII